MKEERILNRATDGCKAVNRGHQAEQRAVTFLQQSGLEILQRNFCCRRGEVDVIARDGDSVVFVEVRWRSDSRRGGAGGKHRSPQAATPCRCRQVLPHALSGRNSSLQV